MQPFPLQTYSLFSGPSVQSNPGGFNPFGIGSAARNVNIHIHTGMNYEVLSIHLVFLGFFGKSGAIVSKGGQGNILLIFLIQLFGILFCSWF